MIRYLRIAAVGQATRAFAEQFPFLTSLAQVTNGLALHRNLKARNNLEHRQGQYDLREHSELSVLRGSFFTLPPRFHSG